MALVNCPECGRVNVSDTAVSCPDCGFAIKDYYDKIKLEEQRLQEEKALQEKREAEERHRRETAGERQKETVAGLEKQIENSSKEIRNGTILEERIEVSNEAEMLEIRKNQAESFLNREITNNSNMAFLLLPFLMFIALCLLYVSWFNFWSVLIILFIVLCVFGAIGMLDENRKFKKYLHLISTDISVLEEVERLMKIKKEQDARQEAIKKHNDEVKAMNYKLSHPKCPNCGSTNTKQISNVNRAASVAMWGLASSKIGKQYQCNQCNHKW